MLAPRQQLLKWVGNKQRFSGEIIRMFPGSYGTYYEPFLGSGAVMGALGPSNGVCSDSLHPLIGIWQTLKSRPEQLKGWYSERWARIASRGKRVAYETAKASYNQHPNAADLLFISRACYGGIVRFRKGDGGISTPCGVHDPITPDRFAARVDVWHRRVQGVRFTCSDFAPVMEAAQAGDLIYCDPPYSYSQSILYGAQAFSLGTLLESVARCKARGVFVALSIDGSKKSGDRLCDLAIPSGLFEQEVFLDCGRSMLRRFQMKGATLEGEQVRDRLLLTY